MIYASEVPSPSQELTTVEIDMHETLLSTDEDPNITSLKLDRIFYRGVLNGQRAADDNVYSDEYYSSKITRNNVLAELLGMPYIIEVNPNIPIKTFDVLNLEIPTAIKLEQHDSNDILDGTYIILGTLYILDNGFFKKMVYVHRVGFNAYQGDLQ